MTPVAVNDHIGIDILLEIDKSTDVMISLLFTIAINAY